MTDDVGRPQDQGRRHRRRSEPSAETRSLLEAYQGAMRAELRELLVELEGKPPAPGLLDQAANAPAVARIRPPIADRARLWDLAIKLGRELAGAIDVAPPPAAARKPNARQAPRVTRSGF